MAVIKDVWWFFQTLFNPSVLIVVCYALKIIHTSLGSQNLHIFVYSLWWLHNWANVFSISHVTALQGKNINNHTCMHNISCPKIHITQTPTVNSLAADLMLIITLRTRSCLIDQWLPMRDWNMLTMFPRLTLVYERWVCWTCGTSPSDIYRWASVWWCAWCSRGTLSSWYTPLTLITWVTKLSLHSIWCVSWWHSWRSS